MHGVARAVPEVRSDSPPVERSVVLVGVVVLDLQITVVQQAVGHQQVVRLVSRETHAASHRESEGEIGRKQNEANANCVPRPERRLRDLDQTPYHIRNGAQ